MAYVVAALTAFLLIVPVELPDKTFVATLVLATRYRPWPVWCGVIVAFGVQTAVAVLAGRLITLLPPSPVRFVAGVLFAVGAVLLVRAARRSGIEEQQKEQEYERKLAGDGDNRRDWFRAAGASFLVLFAAEWGDLSQLLTVGLVARGGHPAAVFVGAWVGLAAVSGTAVLLGRVLLKYVSLALVQYVGAAICALLAILTIVSVFD
jgi:putative Ca2+/H+ antiporter (TMEM165/GDT1 family)